MQKLMLTSDWTMQRCGDTVTYPCSIPCSMYHTLLQNGQIEDPFYRENEAQALPLSEDDYRFTTHFPRPANAPAHIELCFDGIDTIADITLNGKVIGHTDNMHRRWRFDVSDRLLERNTLVVTIFSPLRCIAKKQAEHPLWGVDSTVPGFPHIRKAHYMFGWDWGPKLPDMGIWRDVYLELWDEGRITTVQYLQTHHDGIVDLTVKPEFVCDSPELKWAVALYDPDGERLLKTELFSVSRSGLTFRISDPRLWWTNGLGKQELYTAVLLLTDASGAAIDSRTERIGLRSLTIRQERDEWGESFCLHLNGKDIFAMGANWIPCDNLLPRCTRERQEILLRACVEANFNVVRVWGGGCYPDDAFFDFCDENGLIVWEDFMFACANYRLSDAFWETTEAEIRDNILRLRNHASLGLWCGNNEIENALETWGLPEDPQAREDYLEQFEKRMPAIVKELDGQRFYWRSSPSTYGKCRDSGSNRAGDMHYWEIWHGFKPFTAFRELYYRFCSEYGFESLPSLKTLEHVCDAAQGDLNLMSPVMEAHHKCEGGSEKIMYYLAQMVRYPESIEELVYSSQLVQAECIRSNVEHMRRHRGRCMGSIYWQLNDSNPAISWSSIDYFGRRKALQYYAKRFHAPVLLTAGAFGEPRFNVSNETRRSIFGTIRWEMRDAQSNIVRCGEIKAEIPALSAVFFPRPQGLEEFYTAANKRRHYLSYTLMQGEEILSSGVSLLCVPKQFACRKANVTFEVRRLPECYIITVLSDAFIPAAALDCKGMDVVFSDNWFPVHANIPVHVCVAKRSDLTIDLLRDALYLMG